MGRKRMLLPGRTFLNSIRERKKLSAIFFALLIASGCNQGMQFKKLPEEQFNKMGGEPIGLELPIEELDPSPTGDIPDTSSDEVPAPPLDHEPTPTVPPAACVPDPTGAIIGQKGSMLLEILERGCNTRQRNERPGYRPPTRAELLGKLNRCGANIYKQTAFSTEQQKKTVLGMMGDDPGLINKMWRGLYYTPPYSDHFELYFGLEIGEAREFFCYDGQMFAGVIRTSEYWSYAHDRTWQWENNPEAQARDRAVQKIRSQLIGCINQSLYNPAEVTTVGDDTDMRNRKTCSP